MLRKMISLSLVGLVVVGGLFALTSSTAVMVASQQVTLTVVHPWAGAERELFLPVLKAAEAALKITIKDTILRTEDLKVKLPTEWAAKTAPGDVIFITDVALVKKGGREGHIVDVTGLVKPADFVPGSVEPVTVDTKIYAAPYTQKPKPGFWYRKSFFTKHGLTEPTTWLEFVALLERLKGIKGLEAPIASGDGVGWPLSDVTEHFLVAFGGPTLHKALAELGPVSWSDVELVFKGALVPLLRAGYFGEPAEWTAVLTKWWDGKFGIYFMGIWLAGMVEDKKDLGVFPIPGARGIVSSIDWLFVNAYSKNLDKAKELFNWLVTEGQKIQVQKGGHVATYKPALDLGLYPEPEKSIARALAGAAALTDLDDAIGGAFQKTFWDQLKLLWVAPGRVDEVVSTIREAWEKARGGS